MDVYISVDIEASGPVPGEFSMLALGACVVGDTDKNFYIELKPISKRFEADALAVAGFDLDTLEREGTEPSDAMAAFDAWLASVKPRDGKLIFAAYPLAFDWMFVAYYLHRFLGRNRFGYTGFDFKSFYMGVTGADWQTAGDFSPKQLFETANALTHNAREDAIQQANLLTRLLKYANEQRPQLALE